jgi:hypothetical protein
MRAKSVKIKVDETHTVSGLLLAPPKGRACYVFAHGAGAGMTHAFMEAAAVELASRDIATLRYQFPYMEQGTKRPDPPRIAQATVRAAVAKAKELLPDLPMIAGGKSFGGRMSSQAESVEPMGIKGLAFLGFPLHPAGQPSGDRAKHLFQVKVPMLFLQGTRDALADLTILKTVVRKLGSQGTLHLSEDADHSFHVPVRSGRNDAAVRQDFLDAFARWAASL